MSTEEILKQFKNALISFLDELIEQFPFEGDMVIFRIFLKDRVPIINIINYFISSILPLEKMVKDKDEDFFLNKCDLFESIGGVSEKGKVNKFKNLWKSGTLDKEDKIVVWEWFEAFISITKKYQKSMDQIENKE
jgi:hypothetical protein